MSKISKIKDKVSDVLSLPARAIYGHKAGVADRAAKAIKLARETDHLDADPSTKQGREILSARTFRDQYLNKRNR